MIVMIVKLLRPTNLGGTIIQAETIVEMPEDKALLFERNGTGEIVRDKQDKQDKQDNSDEPKRSNRKR